MPLSTLTQEEGETVRDGVLQQGEMNDTSQQGATSPQQQGKPMHQALVMYQLPTGQRGPRDCQDKWWTLYHRNTCFD